MSSDLINSNIRSILVFSDDTGFPQLLKSLPVELVCGLVGAEIRPAQHPHLQRFAQIHGFPLLIQPRISTPTYPAFVGQLRKLRPDLILVSSYSMMLRPDVLAISRFGGVNIHGALLPQYRGASPIQWALLHNETETGATMHYMTAEFDTGDIIAQRRVPVYFDDTWREIQTRIYVAAEEMLTTELPKLLRQANTRKAQDGSKARHYKRRSPSDGLIDWRRSVLYIYNTIRALVKPHPGAFYYCGADIITLDKYLAIPQVTALKYGKAGEQSLASLFILLAPLNSNTYATLINQNFDAWPLFERPFKPNGETKIPATFDSIRNRNETVIFAVHHIQTSEVIGFCQLCDIDYSRRVANLQYILLNNGTTPNSNDVLEIMRTLLNFAFADLALQCISVHAVRTDLTTARYCEEAGFTQDNTSRQSFSYDGEQVDIVTMAVSDKT